MIKIASIDRIEVGLGLLTLLSLLCRLSDVAFFDKLFLFLGASWYLYYMVRMALSFRQWKTSVAGTLVNAGFLFSASLLAIGLMFRMVSWPGWESVVAAGLGGSLLFAVLGLLIRYTHPTEWKAPWLRAHMIRQGILVSLTVATLLIPQATLFRLFLPELYNQPQATTLYYRNGAIKGQGTLLNGERSGEWIFFSPEGDTLRVVNYP